MIGHRLVEGGQGQPVAMRTQNVIARGARQRRAAAGEGCKKPDPRHLGSVERALAAPLLGALSDSAAQTPRRAGVKRDRGGGHAHTERHRARRAEHRAAADESFRALTRDHRTARGQV